MTSRYKAQQEQGYLIINNKPVETIHVDFSGPRVRVTLDEKKWNVSLTLADSGSVISLWIKPKKENKTNG